MSKQVKDLITKELTERFKELDGVGVINPRGINAIKNNQIRRRLHEKGLKMTVVKNTLARRATGGAKIEGFDKLLDGPSAVIYGKGASISAVARMLLDEKKTDATIELRGMFFDGELYFGDKGVEQVSKLPTREEAIGNLVGLILGPGSKLAGALKGPGGKLGALLKAIEEKAAATPQPAPEAAPAATAAPAADAAPTA
ncbi:MAG: rplJ [Phycisphaerales bacterium]|nr:rplJ [Phycisphaerales bacterium]